LLIGQLICSSASIESGNLFPCVLRSTVLYIALAIALVVARRPSECHANQNCVDWAWICPTKLVATTENRLRDRKTNSRSFIYSQFYQYARLVKISPVDVEIILGLTEIVKKRTAALYEPTFGCAAQVG